jgi:hypothetical protein
VTGKEYADLVGRYIAQNFGARGARVYREVQIGKSIIGKNRRVDLFVVDKASDRAVAIECNHARRDPDRLGGGEP